MKDETPTLQQLLFQLGENRQWIQDSPILPNVWQSYVDHPGQRVDVLITPHRRTRPGQLAATIRDRLLGRQQMTDSELVDIALKWNVASNQSVVAASVTFDELISHLIPLSKWYKDTIVPHLTKLSEYAQLTKRSRKRQRLIDDLEQLDQLPQELPATSVWWMRIIGYVADCGEVDNTLDGEKLLARAMPLLDMSKETSEDIFRIALNRPATEACVDSIRTIKADAASRVFDVNTSRIYWGVLDSGIDARHPAFLDQEGTESRIYATYDFTRVRKIITLASTPGDAAEQALEEEFNIEKPTVKRLGLSLQNGGDIDWEALKPALQIKHTQQELDKYASEIHAHGTHVAGIIGGRAPVVEEDSDDDERTDFLGVCPDIRLIDLRVLDRGGLSVDRKGEPEFDIMAALQFVAHLNSASDEPVVHGVNLSIQLKHDPKNFACGRTPVCEECNRLVSNGVVVVAAAGNMGIESDSSVATTTEGAFRNITIADPGNADAVITVGSTHRKRPFEYGVSFFSSRGPTGDGRQKPDLVAPGEKILGPVLDNGYDTMQGTSQAAPQVSGAAAMLMARHTELIGDPKRIKTILCDSATDLGRERHFQGAGLVDILRALQSI